MNEWPPLQEIGERDRFGQGGRVERPSDRFNEFRAAMIFRDFHKKHNDEYMHDEYQFAKMDGFYLDTNMLVRAYVEVKSRPGVNHEDRDKSILNVRKWTDIQAAQSAHPHIPHFYLDQYEQVLFWSKVSDLAGVLAQEELRPRMIKDSRSVQRSTSNEPCYLIPHELMSKITVASVQMSEQSRAVLSACWQDLHGRAA